MERFVIEGGKALAGTVRPSGSKNEALPTIAACLLTGEPVVLKNVPDIADVRVMFQVLEQLGAKVEHLAEDTVRVTAANIVDTVDTDLARRVRASILFAGPILGRCGRVVLPPPGGDVIGRRRLDTLRDAHSGFVVRADLVGLRRGRDEPPGRGAMDDVERVVALPLGEVRGVGIPFHVLQLEIGSREFVAER